MSRRARPQARPDPQVIADPRTGEPLFAIVPYGEWARSQGRAEDVRDIADFDAAMADRGETFPHEIMVHLAAGESPLRVWREYRGLTQAELAAAAHVRQSTISKIERRQRTGTAQVLARLAGALNLDAGALLPRPD